MDPHYFDNTTKTATTAGTLLTIFVNINSEDLIKTAILAAVGAAISFTTTILLKKIIQRLNR
ncbi:MAG: hypothetical protein ABJB11_01935 [Ferruginibacter sp.]